MAEDLTINTGTKEERYKELIPQIKALITGESDLIANLGNISAALNEQFGWMWVGFYLIKEGELVLGPFQGPVACTRIKKGRGVCGTAWAERKTIIVPDVDAFSDHIACSSISRSEIVIPMMSGDDIIGVFDIDSSELDTFDEIDQKYLEEIVGFIS